MTSFFNETASHYYGYVAFEKVVWKYFLSKDVNFHFCFSRLPRFKNKTITFPEDKLYRKIRPIVKEF